MKSLLLLIGLVGLGYVGLHGVKGGFWDKPLFATEAPEPAPAPAPVPVIAVAPAPAPVKEEIPYANPLHREAYGRTLAVPNPQVIRSRQQIVIVQPQQAPGWKNRTPDTTKRPAGVMTKDVMKLRDKDAPPVQSAR